MDNQRLPSVSETAYIAQLHRWQKKKNQVPGGAKGTFGNVLSMVLSCDSSWGRGRDNSIHPFRNDTKSHLGWAHARHSSLLQIRTVLLLDETVRGKGCRQVERVTSHLAQTP